MISILSRCSYLRQSYLTGVRARLPAWNARGDSLVFRVFPELGRHSFAPPATNFLVASLPAAPLRRYSH